LFLLFQLAILAQRRISLPKLGFAHNLARRRITEANNMPFAATEFEFKNRFWIIGGVIFLAFFCYGLDHTNLAFALTQKILGPTARPDTPVFDRYQLAIVTIGSLFVYLAALLRSWAESYLHSSIVHDAAIHSDQLVAEGPYRHVRNPLYLGNDLLALGLGLLASRLGFVVMVVGMFIVTYRLILREEAGLLATQGESYRRYFDSVPRLWPSLRPRIPSGGAKPNWRDGLTGEIFMWSIAIGMTAFVVTQRIWMFWLVMGVGFAIYFLQAYLRKRPASPGDRS
jgi:protein-S-isoprenylcysteine O-methyltransferase Ste14